MHLIEKKIQYKKLLKQLKESFYEKRFRLEESVQKSSIGSILQELGPKAFEINEVEGIVQFVGPDAYGNKENVIEARKLLNAAGYDLKRHEDAGDSLPLYTYNIIRMGYSEEEIDEEEVL